jgi:hypothetical protein
MMHYWKVEKSKRWCLIGEVCSWGHVLERLPLVPSAFWQPLHKLITTTFWIQQQTMDRNL